MRQEAVDLSIIVPVFNNAATLDELIDRIVAAVEPLGRSFEMIFVDDGSRDASFELLERRARADRRIRAYAMVRNFGSQAAVCAAFDMVRGRQVVALDADLENRPEDIPPILARLDEGYDLVCGYREGRRAPLWSRRLPSALLNAYVRRQTGTTIRDIGCGMRGFQAWMVRDLASEAEHRRLLTPLFLRRARTVAEVRLTPGAPQPGSSHSFPTLLGLAADYFMLTARRPFLIAGLLCAAALVLGAAAMAAGAWTSGLIVLVGALLGGLIALVGEYCQRLYALSQGLPFYQLRRPREDGEQETPM